MAPRTGRRLHIAHRTGYRYADVVDASVVLGLASVVLGADAS